MKVRCDTCNTVYEHGMMDGQHITCPRCKGRTYQPVSQQESQGKGKGHGGGPKLITDDKPPTRRTLNG